MIGKFKRKSKMLFSVKDALDNLPVGVAYFDCKGTPVLVNRMMYRLVFALARVELQSFSEIQDILEEPCVFLNDGTVWQFRCKSIGENNEHTEVTASDITELYFRKNELENANKQQKDVMQRMKRILRNVVSIARNEEILAMKMYVHNELGYALSSSRLFIDSGCVENKDGYVDAQRKIVKILLREVGNDDETDVFAELIESAEKLNMKISIDGVLPGDAESRILLATVVRECLVNTVRHAGGDTVFVKTKVSDGEFISIITNNGQQPKGTIKEGGGLSSLRRKLEKNGGSILITSQPNFSVTVKFPMKEGKKNDKRSCC